MRFANLFFAVSMAIYFTMGRYTSTMWGQFYYTSLFAYVLCAVFVNKKLWVDEVVGGSIVGTIWALYLVRPFFPILFYEWMRFLIGGLIFIFTIIYFFYICYDWHRKSSH